MKLLWVAVWLEFSKCVLFYGPCAQAVPPVLLAKTQGKCSLLCHSRLYVIFLSSEVGGDASAEAVVNIYSEVVKRLRSNFLPVRVPDLLLSQDDPVLHAALSNLAMEVGLSLPLVLLAKTKEAFRLHR